MDFLPTVRRPVRLHRKQAEFRHAPALFRGFVGGRGSGKSWVGAYDLLRRAMAGPAGATYLVGSPTYTVLEDTTLPTFTALAKELGVWRGIKLTPRPNVKLARGVAVRFRSADEPDKMRGPNLSGIWLDEASLMEREAYTVAIGSLREGGRQGWLSATFTPKGLAHWTYETFGKAGPNTFLVRAHTRENPFNPPNFADTLLHEYGPVLGRQELGGEFMSIEGAEWPAEWFERPALWFDDWPNDLTLRVIALDPSKGKDAKHGDYSAFVALGRCRSGLLWAEADLAVRPTDRIIDDGLELGRRFPRETAGPLDAFGVEANAFQELLGTDLIDASKKAGVMLPVHLVTNSVKKETRIRRLTPYLSRSNIRFRHTPGTRLLVQQLRDFPVADHDDGPDALEMALRLAIEVHNGRPPRGR